MPSEPRCLEVSVTRSGGGKVALQDYGNHNSDWFISMGRRFEIPQDWDQDQIDAFQLEKHDELLALVDPLDEAAFEERASQSKAERMQR